MKRRSFDLSLGEGLGSPRSREAQRPDLLPLLDVVFLLVAVLMFSLVRMVRAWSLPLDLPAASSGSDLERSEVLLFSVDRDGRWHWDGRPAEPDALVSVALEQLQADPESRFLIEADRGSPYGEVFALLDGLRAAGIEQVYLIGEPTTAGGN